MTRAVHIRPVNERVAGACPIHEFKGECWSGCYVERVELAKIGRALSSYWYDRKNGMSIKRMPRS